MFCLVIVFQKVCLTFSISYSSLSWKELGFWFKKAMLTGATPAPMFTIITSDPYSRQKYSTKKTSWL